MANSFDAAALLRGANKLLVRAIYLLLSLWVPLVGVAILAWFVRSGAQWLSTHVSSWAGFAFTVACGIAWLIALRLVTPERLRNSEGEVNSTFVMGFVAASGMVWTYIFGVLSFTLMQLGAPPHVFHGVPGTELSQLTDAYLWHLLNMIPGLDINTSLGWKPDVDLQGGWQGVVLVLFRMAIVLQVFTLWGRLTKSGSQHRKRPGEEVGQPVRQ
jgi:hypothetical protein